MIQIKRMTTVVGLAFGVVTATQAATRTWIGNTSTNFATTSNWSAAFQSGDSPTFNAAGTAGRILYNNLAAGTTMGLITFNTAAPAYTINGNAITLGGNIIIAAGSLSAQTINLPMTLSGTRTVTTRAGGGDVTLGGVIGGSGGLTKSGTGTLTLSGNNTFTGPVTINSGGGYLVVGNGGTSGTLGTGDVTDNAALTFNRSDSFTVGNAISGSGSLTKSGAGTLTLTNANTYGGETVISAGTLQVGNGGTTGSLGTGNVTNNSVLAFNRSNSMTASNTISGSGSLTQAGAGTLTLTAANTYTNTTTVLSGGLIVNGSLQSQLITVSAGATLSGTGSVQAATMEAGSILSASGSPGAMTFNGALILSAGSTNIIEIFAENLCDVLKGNAVNTLTANGMFVFDFSNYTTVTNGSTFAVLRNWGSIIVSGASFTTVGLNNTLELDTGKLASDGIVTVIPEPAAISLLFFGALVSITVNRLHHWSKHR